MTTYEGEVAVKYRYMEIKRKPRELRWFCYDEREAEKITDITGREPTIIGDKLFEETRPVKRTGATHQRTTKKVEILESWLDALGGLTIFWAKRLLKISLRKTYPKLQSLPNVSRRYISIKPGKSLGRGESLYYQDKFKSDFLEQRTIYAMNLALEALVKNGYKIWLENRIVKVKDENDKEYRIVIDAGPRRIDGQTPAVHRKILREVKINAGQNLGTIVAVTNTLNYFDYAPLEHLITTIDLEEKKNVRINRPD